jgi:hypothetical protein
MRDHFVRPCVESLEGRRLLTVTLGLDGAGRLHDVTTADFAQTAGLTLTARPGNKLTVAEGATVYGTFPVAKSLNVSLGKTAGGFVNRFDLNNQTLAANVRVELGDTQGLNQFRLTTSPGGTGTLDGNYSVRGGDTGSEFVVFGDFGQAVSNTVNVTGNVKVDMGGGGDDPNSTDPNAGPPDAVSTVGTGPNNTALNVGGNFNASDSTVLALRGSVGGNLISDSSHKATGQLVILGNYGEPLHVAGNTLVKTGDGADTVQVQGAALDGNLEVQTNGGDDFLQLTGDTDLSNAVPTRVGGNISADLGAGNDTVEISALRAPGGQVHLLLGDGNDTLRFTDHASVTIARLIADGGAGTDTYVPGAGNSFGFPVKLQNFP